MQLLLQVNNLNVTFKTREGIVNAVEDVSFKIREKETLAVVGESGCGKSVTALSILQLTDGGSVNGTILFKDNNILKLTEKSMQSVRGNNISMIFQEPMTSLNPLHTVGRQIIEAVRTHKAISSKAAYNQALNLLDDVGIPDPKRCLGAYSFQLSGGMRQRAMIAMALSCKPSLLIADEPTTALDVTVQYQILELLKEFKESLNMAIMFITHDLGVVAEIADRVIVMYAGHIVEEATAEELYESPKHPYTKALFDSIPKLDGPRKSKLNIIAGSVPSALNKPSGCPFYPRCMLSSKEKRCLESIPKSTILNKDHAVKCWMYASSQGVII